MDPSSSSSENVRRLPDNSIRAVVITGTIGVGKTTLAEAISELLHERRLRHALIDVDWLGQVYPPPDPDDPYNMGLSLDNLATIWPNYVATGIRYAIVSATLESRDQLDGLMAAMPGSGCVVVLATARPDKVAERIRGREYGNLLEDFLSRTDALAATIEEARLHDFSIATDEGPPKEAATSLLNRLCWVR